MHRFEYISLAVAALCLPLANSATADHITWAGGADDDWHNLLNWNLITGPPLQWRVPIDGDTATLSDTTSGDVVTLSDHTDQIDGLTVGSGFKLDTEGYLLFVDEAASAVTKIDGADSQIIVDERLSGPNDRGFDTDILDILNGGRLSMNAGLAHIDVEAYIGGSSEIGGKGAVHFTANSGIALVNDGAIRPSGVGDATLTIKGPGGAELDLDGQLFDGREWGVLNVDDGSGVFSGSKTLVIDAPLADEFSSDIIIGQGDRIDFRQTWYQDAGTIDFYGGGSHSLWATLKANTINLEHTTINVHSGIAVLDTSLLLANHTTIDVDATLQIDGTAALFPTCNLDLNDADALIVNGAFTLSQPVIDLDGDLSGDNTIRVGSGGTLTLNVDSIDDDGDPDRFDGTMDIYGILNANVEGGWKNHGSLQLFGGQLNGAAVSNAGVIRGHGSFTTAGLINDGTIAAEGGTLILDSPAGHTDLDGDSGDGVLNAVNGSMIIREEVVRLNGQANVGFGQSLLVEGKLHVDDAGPGMLHLTGGAVRSTDDIYVKGNLLVDGSASKITIEDVATDTRIFFQHTSQCTLNTDLALDGLTNVYAGATIAGTGRLVYTLTDPTNVPAINFEDGVVIDVALRNEARMAFGLWDSGKTGRLDVRAFAQSPTGTLGIYIGGTAVGEFDHLVSAGFVALGGTILVELVDLGSGVFVPSAGDSFEIITAAGDLTGVFDREYYEYAILPDRLLWNIQYDRVGNRVILEVLEALSADFDVDGDVDGDDFLIWQHAFGITDHGDADDDGDTDGDDFLIWQAQFGSEVGSGSTTVPEPSAVGLALIAALGIATRRRRHGK